jgi:tripartite-type tricarboxylate transporter receptor subunit TctC
MLAIEDQRGAGSSVAAEVVVKASPDGHTLFMATGANTINASFTSMPRRKDADFASVQPPKLRMENDAAGKGF